MPRGFSTKAIHIGQEPDALTGSMTVPLYQTSTFAQEAIGKHKGFEYARTNNPTRAAWERNIAALEEGTDAIAFSSGMAAIDAIARLFNAGDHILLAEDMYGGTFRLFDTVLSRHGIAFDTVDMRDLRAVERMIRPTTKLLFTETPTNPLMTISDIATLAQVAHAHGALLAVDNTFASPYFQQPLTLGADIVVHSATKYLGGHSDVVHGVVVVRSQDLAERLHFIQNTVGAIPSPFDCWLLLRSVKTLALRMEQHQRNALAVAQLCQSHPAVKQVYYPGLPSHPQHEIAQRQMRGFSGMVSIELGSRARAERFLTSLQVITLAESLGGVESLACHPDTMTHASIPEPIRRARGITEGLVRLSIGIEDTEDLIEDVRHALDCCGE
ncbi:MAG: cystathionine gamma-synthase [Bacteroidota bacterium]|nr:cystathionine gamma-synthase [Candidatus Kapabacteria bacterium]MCS7303296.1 cystathionine gamma-synthase [Candidatus Kapabacteria bacterium]MCX7937603.1 cystathionine gamma-synthase [Chlorobiota bacterium]MDW8074731.1 cystathionine gamma-synthase [Bacteroidota bacterium]MDW8270793.1 cystathionine gamma-synthase [Bacteroidota bacterium]